jgi:hypothetical protein
MDPNATIRAINEGGIWKYMPKPWERDEMVSVINAALARYETLCHQQRQLEKLARHVKEDTQNLQEHLVSAKPGLQAGKSRKTPETGGGTPPGGPARRKQIRIQKKGRSTDAQGAEEEREAQPKPSKRTIRVVRKPAAPAPETVAESPVEPEAPASSEAAIEDERYQLESKLGAGTFGTVYKAMDTLLDIPVAVKILEPMFGGDDNLAELLRANARLAMQLSQKHIVRLHNFQQADDYFYLVLEFVDGRNFKEIRDLYSTLPLDTVLQILKVGSDALSYAHRHNVIHGDLKPANLMLTNDGVLKLVGFGMAGVVEMLHRSGKQIRSHDLIYLSPEQLNGELPDHRTDIYALGMILYELLTGHPPYSEPIPSRDQLLGGPQELSDLPEEIVPCMEKALCADPNRRWESVERFFNAIMAALGS